MRFAVSLLGVFLFISVFSLSFYIEYDNEEYIDYFKQSIGIKYANISNDADVYIIIDSTELSNTIHFSLFFFGQHDFEGMEDTLTTDIDYESGDFIKRDVLLAYLKAGLVRYIMKTDLASDIDILIKEENNTETYVDKWKGWTFTLDMSGYSIHESSYLSSWTDAVLRADNTDPENRMFVSMDMQYAYDMFIIDPDTFDAEVFQYGCEGGYVMGLGEHCSAGIFVDYIHSSYLNYKNRYTVFPGIEINAFPYSKCTTEQLRVQYMPKFMYASYLDTTIFGRINEILVKNNLKITLDYMRKWGRIYSYMEYEHYIHDLSKYSVGAYIRISINIIKGLSIYTSIYGNIPRDRIYLSGKGATTEEILLKEQSIATDYHYYITTGITFTFGSRFNNGINIRFD